MKTLIKLFNKFQYIFLFFLFTTILVAFYYFLFLERFYPNTYVGGVDVGGLSENEAVAKLQNFNFSNVVTFYYNDKKLSLSYEDLQIKHDVPKSVLDAKTIIHINNIEKFIKYSNPFIKKEYPLIHTYNEKYFQENLIDFYNTLDIPKSVEPYAYLENDRVEIFKGSEGYNLNTSEITKSLNKAISFNKNKNIELNLILDDPSISPETADLFRIRANNLLSKSLELKFEYQTFHPTDNDHVGMLNARGGYNESAILEYVENISSKVNRNPQNPLIVFEGGSIKEFLPAKDGVAVEKEKLKNTIITSLTSFENEDVSYINIDIPTINTPPDYSAGDINDLGINELIGSGGSRYAGSILSRIHNIKLASSKFNGVLIKPEEIISFNKILGDVSKETGYQQAYVIRDGGTVLGDGGGVCQVSTTLFRAALNAGLPIVERSPHSYRVSYYEQGSPPGIDATVYDPSPDLKIQNDTPGHILIQVINDPANKSLIFELYGTHDGRVAEISKPIISGSTAPPEDLYTDDPTLPTGTIKQIDWKAWGAKVYFDYKVTRNGETVQDKRFYSNYKPWQAKFLRGTGPAQ